ncbi:MAG TPA: Ig-like domain-containing protein [Kofleriaceae bacterium]|nr:Ig-like domain-containing protein [Kofleriaceae bacterium]
MHRSTVSPALFCSFALLGGAAHAEPTSAYPWVSDGAAGGPEFLRQVVPAAAAAATGLAKSRTIYLNHTGATLTPGYNDSRANTSSIVTRPTQVPGWNASPADWAATVACMKEIWSRFDVTITDVDPGSGPGSVPGSVPHIEALFARAPGDAGITTNVGGISPFSLSCTVIENSIVFAFTDSLPKAPRAICEVMSQEIAHSYGLDHELLAADPMTYLPYSGNRGFQDHDAQCGETTARPCGIAGSTCRATQNSVQLLLSRLGAADRDHTAPTVGITAPGPSAMVAAGFEITATASDNISVKSVAFYIDGDLVATQMQPPFALTTDPTLVEGAHTITVEASDGDGNTTTEQRDIVVAGPLDPLALGCSAGKHAPGGVFVLTLAAFALARRRRRAASAL